ncbi:MAG: beta galactosidase jelly roll domain-containing protein, partial [Duncaniella sp.]|nr:beta galactosidase jelly roll domain-containing protein [Duncaniella sp.]
MVSKVNFISLVCLALIGVAANFSISAKDSRIIDFNDGWRFALTDGSEIAAMDFDDSGWRNLNLPHDWAIEGDFSEKNPSGTGGGALPGGVGWYRKNFTLTPQQQDKEIFIDFDGAYMNSTVYINGHKLGTRPYGYASFSYDITPYINKSGKNVIAVR